MRLYAFFRNHFFRNKTSLEKTDFIVFGLGNPGKKYYFTRHNIGYRLIDRFSTSLENPKKISTKYAEVVRGTLEPSITVATVKPITFMNHSGAAVAEILKKSNFLENKNKYIVVVDDINLPFGTFRLRCKGTHGGHNGIKSIIATIGPDFPRLRVGIGPLPNTKGMIDFVLGDFNEHEEKKLTEVIQKGREILNTCAAENLTAAMNKYN